MTGKLNIKTLFRLAVRTASPVTCAALASNKYAARFYCCARIFAPRLRPLHLLSQALIVNLHRQYHNANSVAKPLFETWSVKFGGENRYGLNRRQRQRQVETFNEKFLGGGS